MRQIEGFNAARKALSRLTPVESYPIPPSVQRKLEELFGTRDPEQAVRTIISEMHGRGDAAIFDLAMKIDGTELPSLDVPKDEVSSAYLKVDDELIEALKLAAERIGVFHTAQKENVWHEMVTGDTGQLIRPLERVGIYVPGGTASYPSTVLMTAIPARVAGVKEVILTTPPGKNGAVPPATLIAADIAGVDRVLRIGGAQAIAALAYGTESIPRVDKICGPGNIFVVLAKKLVFGVVDIDGLQGPSEVMIIADDTANPEYCAADLLAQAEHDPLAAAMLITTSRELAGKVDQELKKQITGLSRQSIVTESLSRGVIVLIDHLDEAVELANIYAPEHLSLMVEDADACLKKVTNAGCVLIGSASTVVLGDYIAGPSHVLPTGGTARFGSPLNITDFVKLINTIAIDEAGLKQLGKAAALLARAEGLDAHARAVEKRLKPD